MVKQKASSKLQLGLTFLICTTTGITNLAVSSHKASATTTSSVTTLRQPTDEKTIERKAYGDEPFEFHHLSVRGVEITPSQKLSARALAEKAAGNDEDWLEDLAFTITNKWDRAITYLDLELAFPETSATGPKRMYDLDVGVHPAAFGDQVKYGKPLRLKANETYTFHLSKEDLAKIKRFVSRGGFEIAQLNKVVIHTEYLHFEDGTKWEQGNWYRPLPGEEPSAGKPGRYERLSSKPTR